MHIRHYMVCSKSSWIWLAVNNGTALEKLVLACTFEINQITETQSG